MHVRLQTWLPMPIQVCLNGREYLARRLDKAGIGYQKQGNCFTHIDDLTKAQQMMDDLEKRNWVHFLIALARRFNPWLKSTTELMFPTYYWTMRESEYATDVMFADEASLNAIYCLRSSYCLRPPLQIRAFDAVYPGFGPGFPGNCVVAIGRTCFGRCNRSHDGRPNTESAGT